MSRADPARVLLDAVIAFYRAQDRTDDASGKMLDEVCSELAARFGLHAFDCLNAGSSYLEGVL